MDTPPQASLIFAYHMSSQAVSNDSWLTVYLLHKWDIATGQTILLPKKKTKKKRKKNSF